MQRWPWEFHGRYGNRAEQKEGQRPGLTVVFYNGGVLGSEEGSTTLELTGLTDPETQPRDP